MASDPRIRSFGSVEDIDGIATEVKASYDCVSVGDRTFTRSGIEELRHLIVAASWEAAGQGGRMAAENSDGDDGPVFVTMTRRWSASKPGASSVSGSSGSPGASSSLPYALTRSSPCGDAAGIS